MKIKTSELIDATLDYAVAKCLQPGYEEWRLIRWIEQGFAPTANWEQGGPIIEREWIELGAYHDQWRAVFHGEDGSIYQDGPTPLIAAMRCFVASHLGDEIEIPEELL